MSLMKLEVILKELPKAFLFACKSKKWDSYFQERHIEQNQRKNINHRIKRCKEWEQVTIDKRNLL